MKYASLSNFDCVKCNMCTVSCKTNAIQ
ncbi:4Fe-4S binding protein [Labilibaculum manganireducens]